MRILVDAMGGDNAPHEIVLGAIQATEELGVEVTLIGRGEDILTALRGHGHNDLPKGVSVSHASQVVEMTDSPAASGKEKPDSSMAVGLRMLAAGEGDAFVSAGNTGALLAGAILTVKRIKGVKRAALAPIVPTKAGGAILIDCGANLECKPEYLLQFGTMGSLYAQKALGIKTPRVGLLNIGAEETKGPELLKEAYPLLSEAGRRGVIQFIGNIEGRDAAFGAADVIVSDGYAGNIFLKTMEGVGLFFADTLKGLFYKNALTKISALIVKDGLRAFKKTLDYTETGGSPLLGLQKPVIKAHGSSNAKAMKNAIRQARDFAAGNAIPAITESIAAFTAEDNPA
ncbi:MAG: phosphate acyltransferase PlsX [Oscillospiraceae bacterium]|jgi:glycerol-3-phosphate acyltransferase PlsX|nr:phosphate acyltransferase PlsX [Oscillospiraceae bacterium]